MLKSVFYPNKSNSFAYVNVFFLIILVAIGKVEAYTVLFGYFLETIIIGVFNILKMCFASKSSSTKTSVFGNILFFIIHYGGFVAIQSIFVFAIFSVSETNFISQPFNLIENFQTVLKLDGMKIILAVLCTTQLMKFIFDFMIPRKYEEFTVKEIMFMPYIRIFIQQFVVILGMFFVLLSGAGIMAAMLLILLRFLVDFFLVGIRENTMLLGYMVNKLYNGKTSKNKLKKQILLFTE